MRLEAKTEMCVPYGTEATVYGSQIGKHPLDRETFLSKKQETNKKQSAPAKRAIPRDKGSRRELKMNAVTKSRRHSNDLR